MTVPGSDRRTPWGPPVSRVLVGTDLSKGSRVAAIAAAQLPLAAGAHLLLVHVTPAARPGGDASTTLRELEYDVIRALAERGSRATVERRRVVGHPCEAMRGLACEWPAEIVVVGRRGGGGFRELALGSTAERLVRVAPCPVLLVRNARRGAYKRPAIAVDPSEADGALLRETLRLLPRSTQTIDLVHALVTGFGERIAVRTGLSGDDGTRMALQRELKRRADAVARWADATTPPAKRVTVLEGDPRRAIVTFLHKQRSDLVAVQSRGRAALLDVLLGSVAQTLVQDAPCDVLIARDRASVRGESATEPGFRGAGPGHASDRPPRSK